MKIASTEQSADGSGRGALNGVAAKGLTTALICHHDAPLDQHGIGAWLGSFSDLAGVVVVREPFDRIRRRLRRELSRTGPLRFADVLAFRLYYAARLSARDRAWEERSLDELRARYPRAHAPPVLEVSDPSSPEAERFLRDVAPDVVLARCKSLLAKRVFSIPKHGTFVLHPGICPEYRNAHGCFWALAQDDHGKVGATLLRIDEGVDTGPVYGYYTYPFDAAEESHVVIQHRVVLENLGAIGERLVAIAEGSAKPLETRGRASGTWGQPWLTRWLRSRWRARRGRA